VINLKDVALGSIDRPLQDAMRNEEIDDATASRRVATP